MAFYIPGDGVSDSSMDRFDGGVVVARDDDEGGGEAPILHGSYEEEGVDDGVILMVSGANVIVNI